MMKKTILALLVLIIVSCTQDETVDIPSLNYRQSMRTFVVAISRYAKQIDSSFLIIPQNGQELVTDNGEWNGKPQQFYLSAIDATGREELFYGYPADDSLTPDNVMLHLFGLCQLCEENHKEVLTTDYCFTPSRVDHSYHLNEVNGFISFAADHRALDDIPSYPSDPYNVDSADITKISQARNFLYLIDDTFPTKQDFLNAVSATNYDLVIMDLFHDQVAWAAADIDVLRTKQNGGKRLVVCYLSIGEAENYRYYWQGTWRPGTPVWLEKENPDWPGNYKVKYWYKDWQNIIFGNDNSYLKKILDAGFDGVYMDYVDAFEYFESPK
jgi:cysteinyl-tRNA synthetase, unknown class